MSTTFDAFLNSAQYAFAFLVADHGFDLVETISPQDVRSSLTFYKLTFRKNGMQGSVLSVSLATCPVRLELDLDLSLGWPLTPHNTVSICELLAVESPDCRLEIPWGIYSAFGVAQKMTDQYVAIANVLQRFGQRFFAEDESLWQDVRELRRQQLLKLHSEELSKNAELAFKNKNWARTIELLEALGDNRTKLQGSRLQYAKQQIAK